MGAGVDDRQSAPALAREPAKGSTMSNNPRKIIVRDELEQLTLENIKRVRAFLMMEKKNPTLRRVVSLHVEIYRDGTDYAFIFVAKAKAGGSFGAVKFPAAPESMPKVVDAAMRLSNNLELPIYV